MTRDLRTELTFAIESENSEIREAAFKLAERLNNPQIVELLLNYARGQHIGLAVDAITCLGGVKPQGIIEPITSLLESTKDTRLLMACCQALGQIGEPAGGEPLLNILKGKGSLLPPSAEKSSDPCHRRFCSGTNSPPSGGRDAFSFRRRPGCPRERDCSRPGLRLKAHPDQRIAGISNFHKIAKSPQTDHCQRSLATVPRFAGFRAKRSNLRSVGIYCRRTPVPDSPSINEGATRTSRD